MDESVTGLPANSSLVFDSVLFQGKDSVVVNDSDYSNGQACQVLKAGAEVLDTRTIPHGILSGVWMIRVFWNSMSGSDLLSIMIYAEMPDGSALPPPILDETSIDMDGDVNSNTVGTAAILPEFFPNVDYRIVIEGGSGMGATDTIELDYIILAPLPVLHPVLGDIKVIAPDGHLLDMIDYGSVTIIGDGTDTKTSSVTFNTSYRVAPVVITSCSNHHLNHAAEDVTTTGFSAELHNPSGNWSSTETFYWISIGSKNLPFTPSVSDITPP
jgi:hypothetical protein